MSGGRRMWVWVALALVVSLLAGCGGGSDDGHHDRAVLAAAPQATPVPVDQLSVIAVTELADLSAGVAGRAAHLAPDGAHFVHLDMRRTDDGVFHVFTVVTAAGEPGAEIWLNRGDSTHTVRRLDSGSVRWLPDSVHLVMNDDYARSMTEPDIHLINIETGVVQNLTDDQVQDRSWMSSSAASISFDQAPRGIPGDERLYFVRSVRSGSQFNPPALMSIRPDGSDLTQEGVIQTEKALSIFDIDRTRDGHRIAYVSYPNDWQESAETGVWVADSDGQNARKLGALEVEFRGEMLTFAFSTVAFSADGQYVLAHSPAITHYLGSDIFDEEQKRLNPRLSPVRAFSVEDGTSWLLNEESYVTLAGWSPDGHALAYVVQDQHTPDESGLYLSSGPGDPGRLVLPGMFVPSSELTSVSLNSWLTWADNNTILLAREGQGVVIVQLGVE